MAYGALGEIALILLHLLVAGFAVFVGGLLQAVQLGVGHALSVASFTFFHLLGWGVSLLLAVGGLSMMAVTALTCLLMFLVREF